MSGQSAPVVPSRPLAPPASFGEFWPHYLRAHRNARCRALHYLGTTISLICLGVLLATGELRWLLVGTLCGYGCAWIGHFFVEGNRPAAFTNPLWSFLGDWRMYGLWLTGRLGPHLESAERDEVP